MNSMVGNLSCQASSRTIDGRMVASYISLEMEDSAWDNFLQTTPLGQFQQSSQWAQAKSSDGWQPIRLILTLDGQIAGGFQILAQRTRFGRIGYISKGPVAVPEDPALLDYLVGLIVSSIKAHHINALIIQPPDESSIDDALLARHQFLPNHLTDVISATLLMDLSCGMDEIRQRLRRRTKAGIRLAEERGVNIRQADERDIETFFSLMVATCARQQTKPNPATVAVMRAVWKAFYSHGQVRLTFAEYEGEPIAGLLCLCFGKRVTAWKKGWSGRHHERYPNQILTFEAIEWSQRNGYESLDFAALDRDLACTLLRGDPLSESQKKSRHFFNLAFGNKPLLLSESLIYIRNPVVRQIYKIAKIVHRATRTTKGVCP